MNQSVQTIFISISGFAQTSTSLVRFTSVEEKPINWLRVMDAEEVFLSCSNLTLGQYKALVLTRGLVGAAGCVVSLGILGIVLLTSKTKAWENLTKRIYLTNILYTLLYCIVAIAAVNYSHPPSQESAWCEAMGFLLHYTGTLVVVQYCALAFAIMFQITEPVYKLFRKRRDCINLRRPKLWERLLFVVLFLSPLLNTWEPFLPQLPSYGNYGPLCWFRLELTDNCTANTLDVRFLQAVPFAVVSLTYCVTFTISLITLCGLYYKFRMKTTGRSLSRVIPKIFLLTVITFVMTAWFTFSSLPSKSLSDIRSFSTWLENVIATLAATIAILVAVGVYVHFPTHLFVGCRRASHLATRHLQNPITGKQTVHPSEVDHCNVPSHTVCKISHETVTATECSRLIEE